MSSLPAPALAQKLMSQLLNIIQSRNNATTITRFKTLLELDNVDNTRDTDKPVSIQTALAIQTGETTGTRVLDFEYVQDSATSVWIIAHNLQRRPSVSITSHNGNEIYGDILHLDINTLQISFSIPLTGRVYLV